MLLELFKMYKKNGASKTPLEDFTTEALAGLLRLNSIFLDAFLSLIKLPKDNYRITTQKYYFLLDTVDCIVDIVIIGNNNICFIENKVNSYEGWEQLKRYGRALDQYYPNHIKHLRYCTKFPDPKEIAEHNFLQITWRQIGKLVHNDNNKSLIDFYEFLKYHNMSDNYTIDLNYLVSMRNMRDTLNMALFHLDNSRHAFQSFFSNAEFVAQTKLSAINIHDRFGYLFKNIFEDSDFWTELLFSINLGEIEISTQIFINKENKNHNKVIDRIKDYQTFIFIEHDTGTSIILSRKLADFIDDEESDFKIKNWFYDSFAIFAELINKTPELRWKIQVNKQLLLQ